jgi:hypothetical protein
VVLTTSCDDVTGNYEEDVNTQKPSRKAFWEPVKKQYSDDRQSPKSINAEISLESRLLIHHHATVVVQKLLDTKTAVSKSDRF